MQRLSRAVVSLGVLMLLAHAVRAAADVPEQEALDALARYEREARALVANLAAGHEAEVDARVRSLLALSRTILGGFAAAHPACEPPLRASLDLGDRPDAISQDELEREARADAERPAAAPCAAAKQLFLRPATVLVLRREGSVAARQAAEIDAAIAQLALVRTLLLVPAASKPG